MIARLIFCALPALLSGCLGTRQAPPAASNQRSRILAFRRTAVMDTVTAVLDGQVVDLCQHQPLPAAVLLTSPGKIYRTVATPAGRFRFFHIPADTYLITATCPAYSQLAADTVHLGTGDASTIEIGLGCHLDSLR